MVSLGKTLGLFIIGEGVEQSQHADSLREWGCHEAQGFLYAPALTPDQLHSAGTVQEEAMKAVIQRVSSASVTVNGLVVGQIGQGIMVLLGVEKGDTEVPADWLAEKIVGLRIFEDEAGKMNRSLTDIGGAVLAVSQFTLAGNCDKGRRPSFDTAAPADEGRRLYDYFVVALKRPEHTGSNRHFSGRHAGDAG